MAKKECGRGKLKKKKKFFLRVTEIIFKKVPVFTRK